MSKCVKASYIKWCLVPCCTSTTSKTPNKLFFCVPCGSKIRKAWTKAMKRDEKRNKALVDKSTLWCCEDHFSLEDDMENYWQWRLMNNLKTFKLKSGVIPHRFDCQKKKIVKTERKAAMKRIRKALVEDALKMAATTSGSSMELSTSVSPSFDKKPFVSEKKKFKDQETQVCEKNFAEGDFLKSASGYNEKTGRFIEVPLKIQRLKPGAVPSLQPNLPHHFNSTPRKSRESSNDRKKRKEMQSIEAAIDESLKSKQLDEKAQKFSSFSELKDNLPSTKDSWTIVKDEKHTLILVLNVQKVPEGSAKDHPEPKLNPNSLAISQEPKIVVVDPSALVGLQISQSNTESGPTNNVEPDSSMCDDALLALTCEKFPAVEPSSQIPLVNIKQELEDPSYNLSANVERELSKFSQDSSSGSSEKSLFQPPVLIKEEIMSEDEL